MKMKKDLVWNYISLIFMAVAGLLMTAIIALFYDSFALGIFNETYAWYMIISQISVWGIHMAVLKFISECVEPDRRNSILWTSLVIVSVISLSIIIVVETVILCLDGFEWRRSLAIACLGLAFFSLNKVLLNYLNAICEMTAYAVFTSIRYASIVILVFIISYNNLHPDYLAISFPITETMVFIGLRYYIWLKCKTKWKFDKNWIGRLVIFGTKILPSYMVLEMNTKVDIICLGFLIADKAQIGIYSFAVLFAEGFYMIYITIRKFVDPRLAEANEQRKLIDYIKQVKTIMKKYYLSGSLVFFVLILIVYALTCMVMKKVEYWAGLAYIIIICVAIIINGKNIIFGDILAQLGYPLEESALNICTILGNFIFNIILIFIFGTVGAAIATGLSYFILSFYMKYMLKKRIGLEI